MKEFRMTARRQSGETVTRVLRAPSQQAVKQLLEKQEWHIVEIEEQIRESLWKKRIRRNRPLKARMLSHLFQQLAEMMRSGIPFVEAWRLLILEVSNKTQQDKLRQILATMEEGVAPSEVLNQSGLFPPFACQLLYAGEYSGSLETMLGLLGDFYEKTDRQKKLFLQALLYPAFLLFCTLCILVGAVCWVLPVFSEMFAQLHLTLPLLTRLLLRISALVQAHASVIIASVLLSIVGLVYASRRAACRAWCIEQTMRIPAVRRLYLIGCWQRFSSVLAIQLAGGIPLLQAMRRASAVVPLVWYRHKMTRCMTRIEEGGSFSQAIKGELISTPYVETMLTVGESTGSYDTIFYKIAAYYEWRLSVFFTTLRSLLEPLLMTLTGLIIGIVVMALLLPLFDAAAGMG